MTSPPASAQVPVDDQYVTRERSIASIPLLEQGDDLLCGYFCIRMLRAAASASDDPALDARREAGRLNKGLTLADVSAALRRMPGWGSLVSARGPAETVWEGVAHAARSGRPSVLWLPRSRQHEEGHYVIVTGVGEYDDGHVSGEVLRVQDPMLGRRWSSWCEWTAWRPKPRGAGSQVRAFIAPEGWRS
jgi:hypothetical protein